jgi:ferritin-like metal-binding protein YciE
MVVYLNYLYDEKFGSLINLKLTDMKNASSDAAQNLRELFQKELKDIYWVEKELMNAIPKAIENTSSKELREALSTHLKETERQVERIENIFRELGQEPEAETCHAMEGLLKEAEEIMEETQEGLVRDAGIISAVQKVEHYEIASYGTLSSFAHVLGEDKIESMLEETLQEEKHADALLTEIATSKINVEIS